MTAAARRLSPARRAHLAATCGGHWPAHHPRPQPRPCLHALTITAITVRLTPDSHITTLTILIISDNSRELSKHNKQLSGCVSGSLGRLWNMYITLICRSPAEIWVIVIPRRYATLPHRHDVNIVQSQYCCYAMPELRNNFRMPNACYRSLYFT